MAAGWDSTAGIVTPEAVRLQFKEANIGSRGIAFFLDAGLLVTFISVINGVIGLLFAVGATGVPDWVVITTLVVVNFLLFFGYPIFFETLQGGRTPGKSVMGLRVVTVEGAPVTFRHAAIRAALGLVDFFVTLGMGAIFAALLSRRHQRLGDMVAGTVVLRERTAEALPWSLQFTVPYGAESYAVTIDPSGLSPQEYTLVRNFLLRARGLAAGPRREIADRLATALANKLHHDRPPTVTAELFLSCLAARYQERHWPAAQAPVGPAPAPVADPAPAPAQVWGDFTAPQ